MAGPRIWSNRNFSWLFAASAISATGGQFSQIAVPWLALTLAGGAAVLGASVAIMAIPQVALVLLGGIAADRFSAKAILCATSFANALFLAVLAGLVMAGSLNVPLLLGTALVLGISAAFAGPAGGSLVPRILLPDQLARANSVLMMMRQVVMLFGPAIAGGVIAWTASNAPEGDSSGIAVALAITAATFTVSGCLMAFVRVAPLERPAGAKSAISSIVEAFKWLRSDRQLCTLLLYYALMMLILAGPAQVGIPLLANTQLGRGATGYGLLISGLALGSIVGMSVAGLGPRSRIATLGTTILLVDVIGGLSLFALGYMHSIWPAVLLCGLVGLGGGYVQIGVMTWIQRRIPVHMLGRAMSVLMFIMLGSVPLSALVAGVLLTHVTVTTLFTFCGAVLALIALVCLSSVTLRSIDSASAADAATSSAK
ncbi:MAG TPA: MFS transporter [Steroidobacteraceae bacterium]|nr:MFS transporter [Steroidobacteraceae bacterium]